MIKGTKITAVTWPYLSSLFALKITREIINYSTYGFFLMIRAGLPAITTLSPNDFVTTLPAPTITLLPKVTPGQIMDPPPIHTSSPIVTSLLWP